MKNNIFGILFFIFIIGIMTYAIYKVNYSNIQNEANDLEKGKSNVTNAEKGTTLTLGISEFDTINPIITKNKKVQDITKIIFESLTYITEDGKVKPALAKEWETTDNLTYIIKLNSSIKWTDGSYFSSNDVKYTIDRLLKKEGNSVYSESVKYIKEVDIIDNSTLRIILSKPVPFYEYYMNFPILSSKYYGDEDFWKTKKNEAPITTGRFEITEVTSNTITLTKNKDWWNIENDNSVIEKITINLYSSVAELYNAFKMGSIDFISTTNGDYKNYIGTIGYNVTEVEGRNYVFLAFNTQSRFLSDVNVRKAIKYAINKSEIASKIYNKKYKIANFPILSKSYLVKGSNENSYKVDETRKKLESAGWNLKNGEWRKIINYKTTILEFNLVVNSDDKRVNLANYIKNILEEQGIFVNVIRVSSEEYENYLKNKNYDMILCETTSSISPDLTTYFGNDNVSNFSNNEVKEIMEYAHNITEENKLKEKYQKLYEIYNNEVPFLGIARNKIYVITNSYLTGEIKGEWYNLFFGIKEWYTN